MSGTKNMTVVVPQSGKIHASGNKPFPTMPAAPGTAYVYFRHDKNKIFLDTADSKALLAHFSGAAAAQLLPANKHSTKIANTSTTREVVIDKVDPAAGRVVLMWICKNNLQQGKETNLTLSDLPDNSSFAFRCKVHYAAARAFRVSRTLRGNEIHSDLQQYIRTIAKVTLEDFKVVMEEVYFDAGLVNAMQQKVAKHLADGKLSKEEDSTLLSYAQKYDTERKTNIVAGVGTARQQILKERKEREDKAAKEKAAEELTVIHKSVADKPQVLSPYMKKATLATTEKAPAFIKATKTTKLDAENKPVKKTFGNVGGTIGAIHAPPSLAQIKAAADQKKAEKAAAGAPGGGNRQGCAAGTAQQGSTGGFSYAKALGS